ncbi:MAG: hypothetical protein K2J63_12475 [Muribaculaceae bacterium]|nr:hypothetical protein [Muribaculaceae bacterium]
MPESKYGKLRSECLKVNPDKRISMREISDYFEAQLKKGSSSSHNYLRRDSYYFYRSTHLLECIRISTGEYR